jgi:zinc transport system substrate-binding protein
MTSRSTALAFLVGVAAAVVVLPGCSTQPDPWAGQPGPPRVVVSIAPLYSFVKQVGGDRVGVVCLCTQNGPHDYKPSSHDALILRKADLLFGVGLELDERFLSPLIETSGNSKLKFVELGEKIKDEQLLHLDKEAGHKEHEGHDHGEHDPHVWLGIDTSKQMVMTIAEELTAVDPAHAADYEKNAASYCKKLDRLEAEYVKKLKDKKDKRILPLHDSLRYFGRSFGLDITDAIEVKPGEEPSSARKLDIMKMCGDAKKPIHYLAAEPQYEAKTPKSLQTDLKAKGLDVEIFEIDPLETAEAKDLDADWYEKMMRKNLDTLVEKLK